MRISKITSEIRSQFTGRAGSHSVDNCWYSHCNEPTTVAIRMSPGNQGTYFFCTKHYPVFLEHLLDASKTVLEGQKNLVKKQELRIAQIEECMTAIQEEL